MLSVDCINFNSVGVQEPKLHEKDEMGYLDERCPSKKSPVDLGAFGKPNLFVWEKANAGECYSTRSQEKIAH